MKIVSTLRHLLARIRIAPAPPQVVAGQAVAVPAKPGAAAKPVRKRMAQTPLARPGLAPQAPSLLGIEQAVLDRFRPQLRQALQEDLDALAAAQKHGSRPSCCGKPMSNHDTRGVPCLAWMGRVRISARRYRCKSCGRERRPLLEQLEVEPGRPSGLLARLLGLLGYVASYSLAAEMAVHILGVKVNAMTIWRAVQRLGEAAASYTEAISAYHADCRSEAPPASQPPEAVVVAVAAH